MGRSWSCCLSWFVVSNRSPPYFVLPSFSLRLLLLLPSFPFRSYAACRLDTGWTHCLPATSYEVKLVCGDPLMEFINQFLVNGVRCGLKKKQYGPIEINIKVNVQVRNRYEHTPYSLYKCIQTGVRV